ncbi:MAG: polysaccharide deacetylase family protein [Alistipes sp.]|nr:polysaccharide deacetylase family protein [Alistipes sp.]
MLIEQPPKLLRWLYPKAYWRMNTKEKAVYLTFDDGPIPDITPWVLDLLDKYQIKATFFMVGDNVRKHPKEFQMVLERGHRVGNHTFNHLNGVKYLSYNYLANANEADKLINSDLFRPARYRQCDRCDFCFAFCYKLGCKVRKIFHTNYTHNLLCRSDWSNIIA